MRKNGNPNIGVNNFYFNGNYKYETKTKNKQNKF